MSTRNRADRYGAAEGVERAVRDFLVYISVSR
jgi:hypothetical protein